MTKWVKEELKRFPDGRVEIYNDGVLKWSGYPPPQWVPPDPPDTSDVTMVIDDEAPEDFRNIHVANRGIPT